MRRFIGIFIFIVCGLFDISAINVSLQDSLYYTLTKNCDYYPGLFDVWQDRETGKVYLEIKKEQFGKEFVYFNHILDAPAITYHFRGDYQKGKIIRFDRRYGQIECLQINTSYYFDPASPLSRAADANINHSLLAVEKVVATGEQGQVLIDGDELFANEKLQVINMPVSADFPEPLPGALNTEKSAILKIKSYPANTDITVRLVYDVEMPDITALDLADSRFVTTLIQHSIIEVPENDFKPRIYDQRVGYIVENVNDQTSLTGNYYRDLILRWHLVKKNPGEALSEPVEPIVYWIENTTPVEWRDLIKKAVESWNPAFEKAGFKKAIVCKIQPDDADWDAGDIRYHVIRWVSSPVFPFYAYGPCIADPRTGQLLAADVIIEFTPLRNITTSVNLFKGIGHIRGDMSQGCQLQAGLQMAGLGATVFGLTETEKKEMLNQYLAYMVAHEVGHTLGLTHNFHGSTLMSIQEINDPKKRQEQQLSASIMDYLDIDYTARPVKAPVYITTNPGIYDEWAIEYGYQPALTDAALEAKRMQAILDRSIDPRLAYGNDEDIMRGAGINTDPDIAAFDLTSQPLDYSIEMCAIALEKLPGLPSRLIHPDRSYQDLVSGWNYWMRFYLRHLKIIATQIGGVHQDRINAGQKNGLPPFNPVSEAVQQKAMQALRKFAFSPDVFNTMNDLWAYMSPQKRGLNLFWQDDSLNCDPNVHQQVLQIQESCLDFVLHPKVLQRVSNSAKYGNTYTVDKVMNDLTNAIFEEDLKGQVNSFRQNLQHAYIRRLIQVCESGNKSDQSSRVFAFNELNRIMQMLDTSPETDAITNAHRRLLIFSISNYLNGKN